MGSNHSIELKKAYQTKVVGLLDKVVRKTALSVDRDLVLETPVGNPDLWLFNIGSSEKPVYGHFSAYGNGAEGYAGGRARANWLASLNTPNKEEVDRTDRKPSDTVRSKLTSFKIEDTIYITNNVPYIQRLNDGWSTQASSGFIDAIVARNKRQANNVKGIVAEGGFNA